MVHNIYYGKDGTHNILRKILECFRSYRSYITSSLNVLILVYLYPQEPIGVFRRLEDPSAVTH